MQEIQAIVTIFTKFLIATELQVFACTSDHERPSRISFTRLNGTSTGTRISVNAALFWVYSTAHRGMAVCLCWSGLGHHTSENSDIKLAKVDYRLDKKMFVLHKTGLQINSRIRCQIIGNYIQRL